MVHAHRVIGRVGSVQEAPAFLAAVLGKQARERPALGPERQNLVLLVDEIGLGADGLEHRPRCSWVLPADSTIPLPGSPRPAFLPLGQPVRGRAYGILPNPLGAPAWPWHRPGLWQTRAALPRQA